MALNREWHRAHRMPLPDSIKADVEKQLKLRGKR